MSAEPRRAIVDAGEVETRRAQAPGTAADAGHSSSSTWQGLSPAFVREAAADRLKALAHPERLRIVEALAAGPKTVSEIAGAVRRPLSVVSRNLRVLRDAQVVQCSKRGNSVLYVLSDRDVARLAAVAYRGAGGQLRKVVSLAPAAQEIGRAVRQAAAVDSGDDLDIEETG